MSATAQKRSSETSRPVHSCVPSEREGALAAIASAAQTYEFVGIRPRRAHRGENSFVVPVKLNAPHVGAEFDRALDVGMGHCPRDRVWEVVAAQARMDGEDAPEGWSVFVDSDIQAEFLVVPF